MKCTRDTATALVISRILYLPLLSIILLTFDTFVLPGTVTGKPDYARSLKKSVTIRNVILYVRIF